jgi:hypothetical protein
VSSTNSGPGRVTFRFAGGPFLSDTAAGRAIPPEAIASATSIVMERYDCSEADATEHLIDMALRTGVGLTDVVAWLIKDASETPPGC